MNSGRRARITVETERLVVMSGRRKSLYARCPTCDNVVRMFSVDEAAAIARVKALVVYRSLETGTLHFTETSAGALLICAVSLQYFVLKKAEPIRNKP